jgi:DeoR family ulaG and ulaABCDEF operon transcriptional repressor
MGVMEGDPLLIQAEQKLINQAEELVVLIDSSKFAARSSLILCPLERVHTIVTDDSVSTRDARFVEQSGIRLVVAAREAGDDEASSSAA